ncbi:MAG TPA: FAD/NAD(P)-binding protein [Kofleriaceae bacterium]|nr:FAD/NAD(P)-binding protein [Kofleriaceae bacterium]
MTARASIAPAAPGPWLPVPRTIARVDRELADVFTWTFDTPEGFAFQPGQFNMLYVHGIGEVPISISGDPAEPGRLVHTIREVGAITRAMGALAAGEQVGVRGPYGTGWPVDELRGKDVLVVAGGLGLAPLRPAILHLLAHRADYGRVIVLVGARTPADLLFRAELERWRGRFDVRLEAIVDRASRDWYGPVGVVTRLFAGVPVEPDDAVLVCGPEIMMRFVARELEARGLPPTALWMSLERSMKCGVGLCGHCQLGGSFVCKDGPVYRHDRVAAPLLVREL